MSEGRVGSLVQMKPDYTSYEFIEGQTYALEVDLQPDAIQVTEHGEGHPEPQARYESVEFLGSVGSGPWRKFKDWESEAILSIDSHHIISVDG